MTFIALDVGNTRLKWALYDSPRTDAALLSQGAVFLENIDRLADEDCKALPPLMVGQVTTRFMEMTAAT